MHNHLTHIYVYQIENVSIRDQQASHFFFNQLLMTSSNVQCNPLSTGFDALCSRYFAQNVQLKISAKKILFVCGLQLSSKSQSDIT